MDFLYLRNFRPSLFLEKPADFFDHTNTTPFFSDFLYFLRFKMTD